MSTSTPEIIVSAEDLAEAYSLHPSDHPGLLLISNAFDGSGFGSWKRAMTIALSTKSKLYFVDGSLARPAVGSPDLKKWTKCNDMVMSWILNVLSKNIADSIIYAKTARQMWVELEERFGQINGAKLYQVKKEICTISQGAEDITSYFTKVKSLWDQLDDLDEIPICTCSSADKMLKREQNQKLLQFLMGLNDDYNSIRGNILMMSPLPTISQVYSMLVQEEKQREIRSSGHFLGDSASLAVEAYKPTFAHKRRQENANSRFDKTEPRRAGQSNLFCSYCKKPGHSVDKCYRLHGFPPNFKFRNPTRIAALVQTHDIDHTSDNQHTSVSVPGLTPEQSSQLMALLQNVQLNTEAQGINQAPSSAFTSFAGITLHRYRQNLCLLSSLVDWNNIWIIDTGASDHMCHNKALFTAFFSLTTPIAVTLPNGKKEIVTHSGTVIVTQDLVLHGVFYIPNFKYNLLSVSKLSSQDGSIVFFTPKYCIMQAPLVKKPQVLGELIGGLYLLQFRHTTSPAVTASSTCFQDDFASSLSTACSAKGSLHDILTWHARLGHLSLSKLLSLNLFSKDVSKDIIKQCMICSKARQHRLPFPHSQIHSSHVFELVHIDLWGPYRVQTYNGYKYFLTIVDDYSRTTWTHLLATKSNALPLIRAFVEMVFTQFSAKVQTIRSDNALELGLSKDAAQFFSS